MSVMALRAFVPGISTHTSSATENLGSSAAATRDSSAAALALRVVEFVRNVGVAPENSIERVLGQATGRGACVLAELINSTAQVLNVQTLGIEREEL